MGLRGVGRDAPFDKARACVSASRTALFSAFYKQLRKSSSCVFSGLVFGSVLLHKRDDVKLKRNAIPAIWHFDFNLPRIRRVIENPDGSEVMSKLDTSPSGADEANGEPLSPFQTEDIRIAADAARRPIKRFWQGGYSIVYRVN